MRYSLIVPCRVVGFAADVKWSSGSSFAEIAHLQKSSRCCWSWKEVFPLKTNCPKGIRMRSLAIVIDDVSIDLEFLDEVPDIV